MTALKEEKKTFFKCPWCHTSYDSTQFPSDELTEGPWCPICDELMDRVEADATETTETARTFPDDEVVDHWLSSNWN